MNRKITNHGGQKTMIQGLQASGISREQVHLQSQHQTEKELESYELPRNEEQISMMSEMITNIYDSNIKQNKVDKFQKNHGFITAKKGIIFKTLIYLI